MEPVVGHKRSRVSEPPIAPAAIGCGGDEGEDEDQLQHQPEAKRLLLQAPAWASSTPTPQNPHPASRIYRVSRASGGKDRHSKVYTAKGIRDRRVRLSVATAIQFYDLQDRLGLDQPSKAIDWLITAAANAIDALPDLPDAAAFPSHPASAKPPVVVADDNAKSACSSTSDTSKGSVLSLSRSDSRLKARQRARHRSIKDKDDLSQAPTATAAAAAASSFTEMLTGMVADQKQQQQQQVQHAWQPTATADYIGFAQQPRKMHAMAAPGFASPAPHLGNHVTPIAMAPAHHFSLTPAAASAAATEQHTHPHAEMTTHFSFLQQDHHHFIHTSPPATATAAADYNLSFSMSSGLVGVNNTRGTLQSNSHHHLSAHHHLHHPPSLPFLFTPSAAAAAPDNHFATAAAALQLWDVGFRHAADIKEKSKH